MYSITDRVSAIKQIQQYLMGINADVKIIPNGIFDSNTKDAVIAFQKENGINDSGTVDYETHSSLYREYLRSEASRDINEQTDSLISFPMSYGDFGDHIFHINSVLSDILDRYGIYHGIRKSRYYSKETGAAVQTMRKIFMIDKGEHIDEILYGRLIREHRAINKEDVYQGK